MTKVRITRKDLAKMLGVCGRTVARRLKANQWPPLDFCESTHQQGWWRQTLEQAGIIPAQGESR